MGLLGLSQNQTRYGVIIDIGSGSVLVAIVGSQSGQSVPEIIWSKREYAPLKNTEDLQESAKSVMTSLLNALMLLDSEGRTAFREKTGKSKLPETQVTVAAPWSYTVTKVISYKHEEAFSVTDALVEELLRTAHKKVAEELEENERVNSLGLQVICRSIVGLLANGYILRRANNQSIKTLKIIESSAVAQTYLVDALSNVRDKVLPDTNLALYSFMLVYYYILRDLHPEASEYCLVDVTYEATELGIVRDGVLQYTTHTPHGSFSLAREIARVMGIPLEEAHGYLYEADPIARLGQINSQKRTAVEAVIKNYQEQLTELFHETGDALAIPKKIYIHGNYHTEPFFKTVISKAATEATQSSHAIYPVTHELVEKLYPENPTKTGPLQANSDTALLISAQFFHTAEYRTKFEQL